MKFKLLIDVIPKRGKKLKSSKSGLSGWGGHPSPTTPPPWLRTCMSNINQFNFAGDTSISESDMREALNTVCFGKQSIDAIIQGAQGQGIVPFTKDQAMQYWNQYVGKLQPSE